MLGWILNIFRFLVNLWSDLPESIKDKIIDIIIDSFEQLFRAFYKNQKM